MYYSHITTSEQREEELRELLNLLTINHTYFFRNEPHFNALRENIFPEIVGRKAMDQRPVLRIWAAGCSTGEEPYSIAMTALDVIENAEDWDIQIIATDASTAALEKARKGVYPKNAVRHIDADHLEKYFTKGKGAVGGARFADRQERYAIRDTVKNMVNFGFHNLIDEEFPAGFDIIFCRNVVIYFELDTTIKVMNKFYTSLNDKGYLFIGYSETLHFISNKFKMAYSNDAIFYRKAMDEAAPEGQDLTPAAEKIELEKILEEISKKERQAEAKAGQKPAPTLPKRAEDILVEAVKSFHLKEYHRALSLTDEVLTLDKGAVDPHYLAAEIYVNQGKFDEAKERLEAALHLNALFAPAHYLYGCIYMEENVLEKSKESLKKALYIDKDFSLAHFYLAQAYKNEAKVNDAIREYRNTLKVLSTKHLEDIIAYGGGFNIATLMSICRDNIERLKTEL